MSNKTVIVADDTAFVRDRFATALVGAGHKAVTVKSAAELLAQIRTDLAEVDLLVLDLRLPHAGGVAIRTMSPLDQHAKVRVRFRLPGSKVDVEADCRVAWSDRRVGMGLQFEKVDAVDQGAIDEFVDQHFFTNRKA